MADPFLLECALPAWLDGFDRQAEVRDFDGHADHFYRLDAGFRLWRRACLSPDEMPFAYSGTLDIDSDIAGTFTWARATFRDGRLVELLGPFHDAGADTCQTWTPEGAA